MAKNEIPQNWNGQSVLSGDHIPELETDAYMAEAQGLPRDLAAQQVYQQYKRKHHVQAAAMHYKGMKAAQSMGNPQEAQKHMLTYGLHVQAMGLDPYGATHPEILAAAQDPNLAIPYKFTAHPADAFLLSGGAAQPQQPQGGNMGMTKHEVGYELYKVLKKATEVMEGAAQPVKSGPSPFEKLEQDAQKAGKPAPKKEVKEGEAPEQSNPGEGDAAPEEGAVAPTGESGSSGTATGGSVPFSTTLEGTDNAMGKPSAIPGASDFSTTLEGMDSDLKGGSIPNVPFSTTLEGTDAAKLNKEEFKPTNAFAIKLGYAKKHEILNGIHEIGMGLLMKMGAYDMGQAQDMTNPAYTVQPQQQHPYAGLQGWTPAMTSVGHAAMKQAQGGGVYSIHNIGSRHHVIHSDAQGNITPLGIHGDTRSASGMDLAQGAIAHHELMSRGGTGQVTGAAQAPAPLMRSEIYDIQMELAPLYRDIRPLTKHDEKHNIKISRSMGGQRFIDEQGNIYNTLGEAAERLGLQASHITEVLHGQRDQAHGHTFKFID
jgi:hypothetical protein